MTVLHSRPVDLVSSDSLSLTHKGPEGLSALCIGWEAYNKPVRKAGRVPGLEREERESGQRWVIQ